MGQADSKHPRLRDSKCEVAQSIIELSRTQADEVGDGTTSVIILGELCPDYTLGMQLTCVGVHLHLTLHEHEDALSWLSSVVCLPVTFEQPLTLAAAAGEMLHVAEPFLEQNLHPTVIIRGYVKALEAAIKVIDQLAFDLDVNDTAQMLKIISSCIGTKFTSRFGSLVPVRPSWTACCPVQINAPSRRIVQVWQACKAAAVRKLCYIGCCSSPLHHDGLLLTGLAVSAGAGAGRSALRGHQQPGAPGDRHQEVCQGGEDPGRGHQREPRPQGRHVPKGRGGPRAHAQVGLCHDRWCGKLSCLLLLLVGASEQSLRAPVLQLVQQEKAREWTPHSLCTAVAAGMQ